MAEISTIIRQVRQNLAEYKKTRFFASTSTSTGNAGGTTLVSTNLSSYETDFFQGAFLRMLEGSFANKGDFHIASNSTTTITLSESAGGQLLTGLDFEIIEKSVYSDRQIIDWINQSISLLPNIFSKESLSTIIRTKPIAGSSGLATLPNDMVTLLSVNIGGLPTGKMPVDHQNRFISDPFITGTTGSYVWTMFGADTVDANNLYGRIKYRPANTATVYYTYIPKIDAVSDGEAIKLPDYLIDFLVLNVSSMAALSSEDYNLSAIFDGMQKKFLQGLHIKSEKLKAVPN